MTDARQLPLFRRLPIPRGAEPQRRRSPVRRAIASAAQWVQLELAIVLRALVRDDAETDFDFPQRRVIDSTVAAAMPAPKTTAPASVFAYAAQAAHSLRKHGRFGDAAGFTTSRPAPLTVATTRGDGVTRHVGAAYPSNRWTEEREEAERVRRAKQRPPRPPKGARTRGKKVRAWDGEVME